MGLGCRGVRGRARQAGGLLAAALLVVAVAGGCGADKATHPAGPAVVSGKTMYSAQDGGGPYPAATVYLRLRNGTGQWDTKDVNDQGRFTLGVADGGAVLAYQRTHGGKVDFDLLADPVISYVPHSTCDYVALPPMRLGEAGGKKAWLVADTDEPLPSLTITVTRSQSDLLRIGHGPVSTLATSDCVTTWSG